MNDASLLTHCVGSALLCIVVCQQVYWNVACQLVIEIMPTCIVWCCMWAINSEFKLAN